MFARLVDAASAALWDLDPAGAVALGVHQYDGAVAVVASDAIAVKLDRLRALRESLAGVEGLDGGQRIDRAALTAAVDVAVRSWEPGGTLRRDPGTAVGMLDVRPLLVRDFAPYPHRAEAAAAVLDGAPALLEEAGRTWSEHPVPSLLVRRAARRAEAAAWWLDVVLGSGGPPDGDPVAGGALAASAASAAAALRAYAAWLEADLLAGSDDDPAVGGEALEAMLCEGDLLDLGVEGLRSAGEEAMMRDREALQSAAAQVEGAGQPAEVYRQMAAGPAPADGSVVGSARAAVGRLRETAERRRIVGIADEARVTVDVGPLPSFGPPLVVDVPGPAEPSAREAHCTVAEHDAPAGPILEARLAGAVFPGRYVQALHAAAAPTEAARRSSSRGLTEGWSHYAAVTAAEEGHLGGDPRFRVAVLARALVHDCRMVAVVEIHAGGMPLEEAAERFAEHTLCSPAACRAEAERCAADPGAYAPALGRLQIGRLRDAAQRSRGSAFDLGAFHDDLLGRGAPPLGLLPEVIGS